MKTLAIHYGAHDASACIYSNKIEYYFLEERYSRKKHDRNLLHVYKNLVASGQKIDRIVISNFLRCAKIWTLLCQEGLVWALSIKP